jgi:hypothetical protein
MALELAPKTPIPYYLLRYRFSPRAPSDRGTF